MIRHWWQSAFLLFVLFALVACSGASSDAESALVEVPSATPIPPTSSPEPSATPLPTETATFTPTPQPSLTRPKPSHTPAPTDIPATPTPEGPETYGLVFPQATEAEIEAALNAMSHQNTWPIQYRSDIRGYLFNGVLANVQFIEPIQFSDATTLFLKGTIYFRDKTNQTRESTVHLGYQNPNTGLSRLAQMAANVNEPINELVIRSYDDILTDPTLSAQIIVSGSPENPIADNFLNEKGIFTGDQFLMSVNADLGFTSDVVRQFMASGDPSVLPILQGEPVLPFLSLITSK